MFIYQIINLKNNNKYIGSTKNFLNRKNRHLRELRKNKHHSIYLQRAWNKYGEENFLFSIIKEYININYNTLLEIEQNLINQLNPVYNVSKTVKKITMSEDGKRRIAEKESYDWIITNPLGEELLIRNMQKFCRDNNLTQAALWRVANGIASHHKGWKCRYSTDEEARYINRKTRKWKLTSPDNKIFMIENLSKFCKENGLTDSLMIVVANGQQTQHKKWKCERND